MYFVYCDDFARCDDKYATFIHAAFGIKENEAIKLVVFLKNLKKQLKIDTFHCRSLFNGSVREKIGVNYSEDQIFQIYYHILHFITELGNIPPPLITFAKYDDSTWKKILEVKDMSMTDKEGNSSLVKFSVNENTIKYNLEQVNNLRLFSMLGSSNYILYRDKIDKENCAQKIGEYKNRKLMPGVFIDNTISPEGRLPHPTKHEYASHKEIYEIADLIAYVCGTILHQGDCVEQKKDEIFKNWLSRINPLFQEFSPTFF